MQLTHFGHACVLVETPSGDSTRSARLLMDPGAFSNGFEDLQDLDSIMITHQHADHLDLERIPALCEANPGARLIADAASAGYLARKGLTAEVARPGDALELGGAAVHAVGGEHAVIHPDIPVIANIGYLVDHGAFYHPGDAFHVPNQKVDVLGLPTGAPWLKLSEAVDFLRSVAPRVAVPIHEAVLAMPSMHYQQFEQLGPRGTAVTILSTRTPTAV